MRRKLMTKKNERGGGLARFDDAPLRRLSDGLRYSKTRLPPGSLPTEWNCRVDHDQIGLLCQRWPTTAAATQRPRRRDRPPLTPKWNESRVRSAEGPFQGTDRVA